VTAARDKAMVRIAELVIAEEYLAAYRALLAEEIDASLAAEPGVLSLQAVHLQDAPTQVRLLEVYADEAAYLAHLQSPHFLTYKEATAHMVRDLRLLPVTPIRLQLPPEKP